MSEPGAAPERVRVTGPPRRRTPAARTADIDDETRLGGMYMGSLLREQLLDNRTLAPWFDQVQVARYVEEHLSGKGSHSQRLWPLLVLAIWVDKFQVDMSA